VFHSVVATRAHAVESNAANLFGPVAGGRGLWLGRNFVLLRNQSTHHVMDYTGCGRKKSPIWEANIFKTKEDTANIFFYFWKLQQSLVSRD
jgi:hypothetical protein